MKNLLKLLLFIIFLPSGFWGQTKDELINKGIDHVYRLQFDSANTIFQGFINSDPRDPTGYFLQSMTEWWRIYINKDDRSNDDNYLAKVDRCIKICEERIDENENDDWATFLLGGVIGYRGFMNVMRDNWLKAIDDGKQGLNLIQKSYDMNPSNKDAVLGLGIYNYAVDYVVDRYPFLKAVLFFFPKGNKELGLSQLRDVASNGRYSKTEAAVTLAYIHLSYEKNYIEALNYVNSLVSRYPDNPVFGRFLGKCYVGTNNYGAGVQQYRSMLQKADSNVTGYNNNFMRREFNYYLGVCLSRTGDPDGALKNYETAIEICKSLDKEGEESPYYVFSVLGSGTIYEMKGNKPEAIRLYDRVLAMRDVENSRETAQKLKDNALK